ncbi:MAG: Tripartite DNA replication factor [Marteilia pararefringens]
MSTFNIYNFPFSDTNDKKLMVEDVQNEQRKHEIYLDPMWSNATFLKPNTLINVINEPGGNTDMKNLLLIPPQKATALDNILVVNPNHLISTTDLSTSFFCMRKAFLAQKFISGSKTNQAMLLGILVHDLFQKSMILKLKSECEIKDKIWSLIRSPDYIRCLLMCGMNEDELFNMSRPYIQNYLEWTNGDAGLDDSREAPIFTQKLLMSPRHKKVIKSNNCLETFDIENIVDVETNIRSERLGIKGRIDMIVDIKMKNGQRLKNIPLELKTGKANFSSSHRGQTMLYSAMINENRQTKSDEHTKSILLYLKTGESELINFRHKEMRDMIIARNILESYLIASPKKKTQKITDQPIQEEFDDLVSCMPEIPEPINRYDTCKDCEMKNICGLMTSVSKTEIKKPNHSGNYIANQATQHLSNKDLLYFVKWYQILEFEEKEISRKKMETERLNVDDLESTENKIAKKYTFDSFDEESKTMRFNNDNPDISFDLKTGEYCLVSPFDLEYSSADIGKIESISGENIVIFFKNDIYINKYKKGLVCRIEIYELNKLFRHNHFFLSELFRDTPEINHLRKIIVEHEESREDLLKDETAHEKLIGMENLNDEQQIALQKSINCHKYFLINGFPGTGKTTTLAVLISNLANIGKKVLISTHTNCALDHILTKLHKLNAKFIRFGQSKINYDIFGEETFHKLPDSVYFEELLKNTENSLEMKKILNDCNIFASTCISTSDQLIRNMKFDFCIIDEASQLLQASVIGPISLASKFILVGDQNQLPPIVYSEYGKKAKNISLFDHLIDKKYHLNIQNLTKQYRMNHPIMEIANKLVYKDCLTCGSQDSANKTLLSIKSSIDEYKVEESMKSKYGNSIDPIISAALEDSAIFLNYSRKSISAKFGNDECLLENQFEAECVVDFAEIFSKIGFQQNQIGIISPYTSQVSLIKSLAKLRNINLNSNTVDQFQGQDKPIIIISFVKSYVNPLKSKAFSLLENSILADIRRINVAITRAQCKLILIGDCKTLVYSEPICRLIKIMEERNSIVNI